MRLNHLQPLLRNSQSGLSLLELAIVMVFISLALIPIVRMTGGPTSSDGNAAQITGTKNKEALLANTMINKVLAGDYSNFKCGGNGSPLSFNPQTELPQGTQVASFGRCQSANGNNPLYYEWKVLNLTASNNKQALPSQNQYFQATFRITDARNNDLLTMPVNFFHNFGAFEQPNTQTGVMLSMDISGSMAYYAKNLIPYFSGSNNSYYQGIFYSSPYMFYRYKNFPTSSNWGSFPANPPNQVVLNMWDDSQLDLSTGKQIAGSSPAGKDPNPETPYNEAFPFSQVTAANPAFGQWGSGVLGSGDCTSNNDAIWSNDRNLRYTFLPYPIDNTNNSRNIVNQLCRQKASTADWSNTINQNLSRIEAARTAALSLLLNLESTPSVAQSIEMGFIPWDHYAHTQQMVALEKASVIPGVPGVHFRNMRDRLLWINRADPASNTSGNPVVASGATSIYEGVEYARRQLLAKNFDRRIIVLLTDGDPYPESGLNTKANLPGYALNTLGHNAPKNQQVTLFTVGLIAADNNLLNNMATGTPDGQNFAANDVADLKPIFDAISYQIQKLALLSTADRYGISF